jgi:alpha-beta hydrolase superfamily lysophospholipase
MVRLLLSARNRLGTRDVVVCKIPTVGVLRAEVLPKSRLAPELSCCLGAALAHTLRARDIPVLSVHGTADPLVPCEQTTRLTHRLLEVGNRSAEQVLIPGALHRFTESEIETAYGPVFDFLRRQGVL